MKTSYFKIVFLLVLTGMISANCISQEIKEKKFTKSFNTSSSVNVEIWNKFGNLNLKTWDKNEVSVEAIIKIENYPAAKAEEYLNGINITASEQKDLIIVKTEFDEKALKAVENQNKGKKITVHYTIYHPVYQKFSLNNRYGDINIEEIGGKSTFNVKYGDFNATKLICDESKPFTTLDISFGNAKIVKTTWMQFHSSYSNITVDEATAMIIISKYSNISGGNIHSVVLDSKYDNYTIFNVKNLIAEAKYSTLTISEVSKQMHVTADYGHVKVKNVPTGFEKIKMDAKYGEFEILISSAACYQIAASIDYGSIGVPQKANIDRVKGTTSEKINGWVGCKGGSESVVEINGKYSEFNLFK